MTYTLSLCFGMFLGICGGLVTSQHASLDDCKKERETQINISKNIVFAVCSLTKEGVQK